VLGNRSWPLVKNTIPTRSRIIVSRGLRHTHANLMLRAGVSPKIVSERLGHSTVSLTLDVYSHLVPGLQEAAARAFDQVMATANASVSSGGPLAKC
jgi:integrase